VITLLPGVFTRWRIDFEDGRRKEHGRKVTSRLVECTIRFLASAGVVTMLAGCSAVVSSTTSRLAESLADALENQNDIETVRQGAPAYLVLIDGLIADDPDNPEVLLAGAQLYSSYAGAFVEDKDRAKRLSLKGRDYGWAGLCASVSKFCGTQTAPYDDFEAVIDDIGSKHIAALFTSASAWATWIQANTDDWVAIADKARVDKMIQRVVQLDERYQGGAPYLFLGVLATLVPEAMGGKPEEGRRNFERAIELSGGRDLMAKVLLARRYARLVFDRELHDRLCREVLDADPVHAGLTLSNTLAQEEARRLLDDSEDYFGE
jgi:hypothetical protein